MHKIKQGFIDMPRVVFRLFFIACISLFIACDDKLSNDMFSDGSSARSSQEFVLKTTKGKEISILVKEPHQIQMQTQKFKNKAILLDFWATWCPPCIKEIPHLKSLVKKYEGKLELIGVLAEEDKSAIELNKFMTKHKVDYTITTTDETDINVNLLRVLTNLRTLPFKILYDKNGTYVNHYYGAIPEEMLDIDIQKAINR